MEKQTADALKGNKIIEELAVTCGMRKTEMESFIACLHVYTSKGYSLESALAMHQNQMVRFVNNVRQLADEVKPLAVEWFYQA